MLSLYNRFDFLLHNFLFLENYVKLSTYFGVRTLCNIHTGNIVFLELFSYDIFSIHKQFFIGLCVGISKRKLMSKIFLRNVLGGVLINVQCFLNSPVVYTIRRSRKRKLNITSSKLFFILDLPYLFRINKFVLPEFIFVKKKRKKKKNAF